MTARPVRSLVAGLVLGLPIAAALPHVTGAPGSPLLVLAWLSNSTCRSVKGVRPVAR